MVLRGTHGEQDMRVQELRVPAHMPTNLISLFDDPPPLSLSRFLALSLQLVGVGAVGGGVSRKLQDGRASTMYNEQFSGSQAYILQS